MDKELLDFCRVKKIFDKGFGFLSSINYQQDVFFHFSNIKDDKVREELTKLKRGVVYLYYTSRLEKNKRKVSKIWLNLNDVPHYLIPDFKLKIIDELNSGKTNVFELAHIIKELKAGNHIDRNEFNLVLNSNKIQTNPSVVKQILTDEEMILFGDIDNYFTRVRDQNINNNIWTSEILNKIYR